METNLKLKIDGDLTPEEFRKAVDAFFSLVKDVSSEIKDAKEIPWKVEVDKGSTIIELVYSPTIENVKFQKAANTVARAIPNGLSKLERGRIQRPPLYFKDKALQHVRELAAVKTKSSNIKEVNITSESYKRGFQKLPFSLTQRAIATVEELIGADYHSFGSVEGKLQTLSERGEKKCYIYDELFDQKIVCRIHGAIFQKAYNAFGKRVAVSGIVHYNKRGLPIEVNVQDIDIFKSDEELPSLKTLRGVFK